MLSALSATQTLALSVHMVFGKVPTVAIGVTLVPVMR